MKNQNLPVAIIGGAPVGLAAAAHLKMANQQFVLFESGRQFCVILLYYVMISKKFSIRALIFVKRLFILIKNTGFGGYYNIVS